MEVNTGISEKDLFEAILAEEDVPMYDPAVYLSPKIAAERWHCSTKTAIDTLKRRAELEPVEVRDPGTGKKFIAFKARK